jgi:hypothetical protein
MGHAGAYGISWMPKEIDGVKIVAHGGSTRGHQTGFEMAPEAGHCHRVSSARVN